MITALVQFSLREPMQLEKAREAFSKSAHKYNGVAGLVRKYFTVTEDGAAIGGVYLWRSKADAEAFYSEAWKAAIVAKYGSPPTVMYLHVPVVVDNTPADAPASGA